MKKTFILFLGLLLLLTGCNNKETNDNKTTTNITTTQESIDITSEITEEDTNDEENVTEEVSTTTKKETTTTSEANTSTITTSTTKNSTTTTKKTTTTTKKTTTTTTTKKTTATTTTTKKTTTTTTKKTTTTTTSTLTEKEVYNKMIALKSKYPDGTPWGNDKCYYWNGGIYNKGCGCAGFAFTLSDAAFGTASATQHTDISKIRVGDILRINNDTHSVIVLEVTSTGVTIAEGNMTIVGVFENGVYWGRKLTTSELKSSVDYILTRW